MARLITLDEESHKYTVDGKTVPAVSEITRFISREVYSEVMQSTLDNAARRGTKVHKATEALDKYGDVEADEDILPYLEAYVKFRREHKVQWLKIEWMADCEGEFCGTIDRLGTVDGTLSIVDIKTSSQLQKVLYTAQLNFYLRIARANGLEPKKLYILKLVKDGTYKLTEMQIDQELVDALLKLHHALEKKPRKKKGE